VKLVESLAFKQYLELDATIRDLVYDFYDCNFRACISLLEENKVFATSLV
jgi:hypothetical protein